VLVLLFIPATMLFGFLAGLIGLVWPILAIPFAAVAWALLIYIIKIAEWTSSIPLASIEVKGFALPMLIAYYAILIFVMWTETKKLAKMPV
ncbi:MAG: ComEC/Rec2 family competence protein, partial [Candidatus Doudnabacteria bacterium]|nr:ComEC/Rec2 family competence protein [Candidatus Doudnabacteria bacterium]